MREKEQLRKQEPASSPGREIEVSDDNHQDRGDTGQYPLNILLETPMFWAGGHIIFLQAI